MEVTAESARLKFEIDEKTINNYMRSYLPGTLLTIEQSGKIIITGKYGILPFRIIVNNIKHDSKYISLIFGSSFISIITSILVKFLKEEYLHFNLLKKELEIDILKLIKSPNSSMPQNIAIDDIVIEKCYLEDKKITVVVGMSGQYKIF